MLTSTKLDPQYITKHTTMKNQEMIKKITKTSLPILKENGVVKAGLFGSIVRGENKKKSDIDFLVKFRGRKSLLDLVRLKLQLETKLKKRVDVLTYKSVHPLIKESIMNEEVKIL